MLSTHSSMCTLVRYLYIRVIHMCYFSLIILFILVYYCSYNVCMIFYFFFFFQAEDGIRDLTVTGVQTCALPIYERDDSFKENFVRGVITQERSDKEHDEYMRTLRNEAYIKPAKNYEEVVQPLRSEEHTSELQSQSNLVCRLLLEKKKIHRCPYSSWLDISSDCSIRCRVLFSLSPRICIFTAGRTP